MRNVFAVLLIVLCWFALVWGVSGSARWAAAVGSVLSIGTVVAGLYDVDGEG